MRSSSLLAVVLAAVVLFSGSGAGASAEPQAVTLGEAQSAILTGALPSTREPARSAATWCGTPARADLRPNTLSGFPVHWIYVLPSDAPDRFTTFASAMQTDAEAIDAWWRREDPVRVPRNDLAQLSCGAQLDISTLRLPQSSAQLAGQEGRFVTLFDALLAANFRSRFTKYIVYFDGPVAEADICGQGASSSSGIGVAAVYVQACAGVSTAAVAAHEFLHTLGAVSRNAPHNCPEPNGGHTCDAASDLMHPFLDRSAARREDPRSGSRRLLRARRQLLRHPGRSLARAARSSAAARGHDLRPWRRDGRRPRPRLRTELHDDLEHGHAARPDRGSSSRRKARPLGRRVQRRLDVRGRRRPRRNGVRGLRAVGLPAHRLRLRTGSRTQLERRNHLSAEVLRHVPLVRPAPPDRDPGEGLEVPLLVGWVPQQEAHVHPADDGGDERARGLRSRLVGARLASPFLA